MDIKGTAFLTRRNQVAKLIGSERAFDDFQAEYAKNDPFFAHTILATTLIPAKSFLAFYDEVWRRFFKSDSQIHWKLGEESAQWALTKGPYMVYLSTRDPQLFVERVMNKIWAAYFNGGELKTTLENGVAHVKIINLPIAHVYFEYLVMGFIKRCFELIGFARQKVEKVTGWDDPSKVIYYRFVLGPQSK